MTETLALADAASYAAFLRRIGHRVLRTPTMNWFDASPFFFLSAPPHRLYSPEEGDIRAALGRFPCLGVRFATTMDGSGKPSYQIVCEDSEYDLSQLSANVRSKVRRGLKRCCVKPLTADVLVGHGRKVHEDTLARQGRERAWSGKRWNRFCEAVSDAPGFEVWGAWHGADLAAFLVTVSFEEGVEFMLARSRTDLLGAYPNNALLFTVTREMLVHRRVARVTFGLESLELVGPLDEFKFSMGFRERPVRQRVVLQPVLGALLRHARLRAAVYQWMGRGGPGSPLRKAAGLLRFAEEGRL